jgi:hypothetical protein
VTYTLNPIETGGGSVYGVRIPTPNAQRSYWVEFRQPLGFDAWTTWNSNGAQVRLASPFQFYCSGCNGWSNDTQLIHPLAGGTNFNDVAFGVGSTYTDPDYPLSIRVVSMSASSLTVQVTTPQSTGPSSTSLASSANPAVAGSSIRFTATVTGTAPTGTVAFRDGGSVLAGCGSVALAGSGNTRSSSCTTSSLAVGTHGIVASYSGDAVNVGSSSAPLSQTVSTGGWLGYLYGGNVATGSSSAVAAGASNVASGQGAFVGAGTANLASGVSSLVIGGFSNEAAAIDSLVGAGAGNRATGPRSVVVGGGFNLASGPWSFIGGGGRDGTASTTAGSNALDQVAVAKWSTIVGGSGNRAGTTTAQTGATVTGGERNQATNTDATVGGGTANIAGGTYATIVGGQGNAAAGGGSAVAGGTANGASGVAAIAAGASALASGSYAVAIGRRAQSGASGSITLADATNSAVANNTANQFFARATGGVRIVSGIGAGGAPVAGVSLAAGGGSWASLSDRRAKRDLHEVDAQAVLARLAGVPLYTWRYMAETSGALHLGPTAQDFRSAFGLGDSARSISMVDADGVALATVQALLARIDSQERTLAERAARIAALRARVMALADLEAQAAALDDALAALLAGRAPATVRHAAERRSERKLGDRRDR